MAAGTTAQELQTCTFQGPMLRNTTNIPRKDPQERQERKKFVAGEEKKRYCGRSREGRSSGRTVLGRAHDKPSPSETPHHETVKPTPTQTHHKPHTTHNTKSQSRFWPKSAIPLKHQRWPKLVWPNSVAKVGLAKVGLAKVGHDRFQ